MKNATERVTEAIRQRILMGGWAPGAKLQPAALAREFSTSSTVLREALTRLGGGSLITTEANRGFFVRNLDLQELQDVTELRVRTETLAVELAISRGDINWEAGLIAALYRLNKVPRRREDDPSQVSNEWQVLHKEFHLKVLEACDCKPIMDLASDLFDSTELYRCWVAKLVSPESRDVDGEHQRIVDAIVAKDAEAASVALREHYEATVKVILEAGLKSVAVESIPTAN